MSEITNEVCNLKHEQINERLKTVDEKLEKVLDKLENIDKFIQGHEYRLVALEKTSEDFKKVKTAVIYKILTGLAMAAAAGLGLDKFIN